MGNGEFSKEHLFTPKFKASWLIPSLSIIKLHKSSEGGSIELVVFIIFTIITSTILVIGGLYRVYKILRRKTRRFNFK